MVLSVCPQTFKTAPWRLLRGLVVHGIGRLAAALKTALYLCPAVCPQTFKIAARRLLCGLGVHGIGRLVIVLKTALFSFPVPLYF